MNNSLVPDISQQLAAARNHLRGTSAPPPGGSDRLRKQAEDFESVFLTEALKTMFSGIDTNGPFGGGFGEEQFREFLIEEYAGSIVKAGGIGVADEVYRQMLALQEVEQ